MCQLRLLFCRRDRLASDRIQYTNKIYTARMASLEREKEKPCQPGIMALSQANNQLAVSLHQLLSEEKGNVFFSPFSVSAAMAMLLCATEDETESELRSALGYESAGIQTDDVARNFKEQISALLKTSDSYTFACANSLVSEKTFKVKDQYKKILSDSFQALLKEADFRKEGENVVNEINAWVKGKTNNMIPKLIPKPLSPLTVMVLLNAVYFKGDWLRKFDKNLTKSENFYNKGLEKESKKVKMMHMNGNFPYGENESFQVLQLPYVGEELSMLIILPLSKNGLVSVESSLKPSFIRDIQKRMIQRKVIVSLPRFRLEYSKSLKEPFEKLGVKRAFTAGEAQFGVATDATELYVSKIIHSAVLEVNEEGSEAAAATAVCVAARSKPSKPYVPVFCADHPFAFVIYDTRSDLVLFMGRLEEL